MSHRNAPHAGARITCHANGGERFDQDATRAGLHRKGVDSWRFETITSTASCTAARLTAVPLSVRMTCDACARARCVPMRHCRTPQTNDADRAGAAHESTEAMKAIVDALHLAHRAAHELSLLARRGLPQLRVCSSCACDDDARSFPRFNMTGVTVTYVRRKCGELICAERLYMCHGGTFYMT